MKVKELMNLPAFPRSYAGEPKNDGMTLYQYYIGCALQGLCASQTIYKADDMAKVAEDTARATIQALASKD